jgi:hypothetical protein
MQSDRSVAPASSVLMKVVLEHRTYEQHGDEWIEIDAARRPRRFLNRFAALANTALALAAIGIVAASLGLLLLPIAFLAAWWLRATSSTETRRPQ